MVLFIGRPYLTTFCFIVMNKYGVEVGQVYLAADSGKYGCIVIGIDEAVEDAVVLNFSCSQTNLTYQRIDLFKLTTARYSLVEGLSDCNICDLLCSLQVALRLPTSS